MLKRYNPPKYNHLFLSCSDTESDLDDDDEISSENIYNQGPIQEKIDEENGQDKEETFKKMQETEVIKETKIYQNFMKQLSIPITLESSSSSSTTIPFISWQKFGESIKKKYEQPLHYLTHKLLEQWDQSREKSKNKKIKPIGSVIHSKKAEAAIWVVEEFNREFVSHHHLAKLWISDPNYHDFVGEILSKD